MKTIHVLEGLPQAEHRNMLNVCVLSSIKICNSEGIKRRSQDCTDVCFRDFYRVSWNEMCDRNYSQEKKQFRAAAAQDLLETANGDPYFLKVITRNESRVYGYEPETKPQSFSRSCFDHHFQRRYGKVRTKSKQ